MKNKRSVVVLGLLLVVGIVSSLAVVSAYRGDPSVTGPNYSEDRHDAMTQAFADGDYDAWRSLMEQNGARGRVLDVVDESNFDVFSRMHQAMIDGDVELASQLRSELGLREGYGPRDQGVRGQGRGGCMRY